MTQKRRLKICFDIFIFWHRTSFFNQKGTNCHLLVRPRFETGRLRHPLASRLNANSQKGWVIKDQVEKNNPSLIRTRIQATCRHCRKWFTHGSRALAIYICLVLFLMLVQLVAISNIEETRNLSWASPTVNHQHTDNNDKLYCLGKSIFIYSPHQ